MTRYLPLIPGLHWLWVDVPLTYTLQCRNMYIYYVYTVVCTIYTNNINTNTSPATSKTKAECSLEVIPGFV